MKTKTRKTPSNTIKALLHLAQPGARLLLVGNGAFLVNPASHDHWYCNTSTFDGLRANEWINAPTSIDANVIEASITEAGRDIAAAIEDAKRGYTQLSLEEVLEELEATRAAQVDAETTEQAAEQKEESNPMPLTTFEHVAEHSADVTAEQISKCHKIIAPDGKEIYAVENERGDPGLDGEILEYAVRYSPERGFSCTCPSGAEGFAHVHHMSGVCKHVRWSVAAALEERAYMSELAAKEQAAEEARRQDSEAGTRKHYLAINGKEATPAEYARVMLAQGAQPSEAEVQRDLQRYAPRPFNFMR